MLIPVEAAGAPAFDFEAAAEEFDNLLNTYGSDVFMPGISGGVRLAPVLDVKAMTQNLALQAYQEQPHDKHLFYCRRSLLGIVTPGRSFLWPGAAGTIRLSVSKVYAERHANTTLFLIIVCDEVTGPQA